MKINEKDVCELYEKYSTIKIAKIYKTYPTKIARILLRNGVKLRTDKNYLIGNKHNKQFKINTDFFYNINDEAFVYFMGLMSADGNNNPTHGSIKIALQEEDGDILKKINKRIHDNRRPLKLCPPQGYGTKMTYNLLIHDRKISKHLCELGLLPNKTFILKYPQWLSKNMARHFIRGYFDGDGCIMINYKQYFRGEFRILSTKHMIDGIARVLNHECKVNCGITLRKNIYELRVSGNNQILRVLDWMYKDATYYMNRKFKKYKELRGHYAVALQTYH